MPLPAALAGASVLVGHADDAWEFVSGLAGLGGAKYAGKRIPNQPSDADVSDFFDRLSESDTGLLVRAFQAYRPGNKVPTNPFEWGHAAMGGSDAKFTTSGGRTFGELFWRLWKQYMNDGVPSALAHEEGMVYMSDDDGGGGGGSEAANVIKQIKDDIVGTVTNILRGAGEGAASGARAAASGAHTGSQLGAFSMSHVFVGILVLVVVVMLVRRK